MRPRPQLFSIDLYGKLSQTLACLYQSFCHFNTAFKYCVSSVCESFIFFRSITSKRIHPSSLMAKNSPCFATYLLSFLFHKNINVISGYSASVKRQAGQDSIQIRFQDILLRLRNAEVTMENWQHLMEQTPTKILDTKDTRYVSIC